MWGPSDFTCESLWEYSAKNEYQLSGENKNKLFDNVFSGCNSFT